MELWDIYDEQRQPKNRTHIRGNPMNKGDYHLVVHIWIQNPKGEFLITKRSPNKDCYPNLWEAPGGCAISGDDSLSAAIREAKEEIGICLNKNNAQLFDSFLHKDAHCDIWIFSQEIDLNDVVLQESETCDVLWATKEEIWNLIRNNKFMPYLPYFEQMLKA